MRKKKYKKFEKELQSQPPAVKNYFDAGFLATQNILTGKTTENSKKKLKQLISTDNKNDEVQKILTDILHDNRDSSKNIKNILQLN